jgi:hypothetical protein
VFWICCDLFAAASGEVGVASRMYNPLRYLWERSNVDGDDARRRKVSYRQFVAVIEASRCTRIDGFAHSMFKADSELAAEAFDRHQN